MGKKKERLPRRQPEVESDSDEEGNEFEEADIQALARASLKPGETLLGEGGETLHVESDAANAESRGICNTPALLQKVEDIAYRVPEGAQRVPWIDTLAIVDQKELPKGVSAKDGVKLEAAFLSLAGDGVKEAYRRLHVMRVPCSRPPDFYAEMLRPDVQMYKVRAQAAEESRRIRNVEGRKKAQAAKKFAKKAKSKKLEARAQEKRNFLEGVAEWRQKSKRDNNKDEEDLEDVLNRHGTKRDADGNEQVGRGKMKRNFKKEAKDKKWGHGGKKRGMKRNDSKSSRDFRDSPWAKGKGKGKGKGSAKGSKGAGKRKRK